MDERRRVGDDELGASFRQVRADGGQPHRVRRRGLRGAAACPRRRAPVLGSGAGLEESRATPRPAQTRALALRKNSSTATHVFLFFYSKFKFNFNFLIKKTIKPRRWR